MPREPSTRFTTQFPLGCRVSEVVVPESHCSPDTHGVLVLFSPSLYSETVFTVFFLAISDSCVKAAHQQQECVNMVSGIPSVNREVIKFLAEFLHRMAQEENVVVTKMGVDNLAMVFAPAFLRSHDPQTMLLNTYNEGSFVQNLIDAHASL